MNRPRPNVPDATVEADRPTQRVATLRPPDGTAVPPPARSEGFDYPFDEFRTGVSPGTPTSAKVARRKRSLRHVHSFDRIELPHTGVFKTPVALLDLALSPQLFAASRKAFGKPTEERTRITERYQREVDPELPEVGAIVEKYRLEELLGVGGFAAVYRATHLLLHTPVALKMLRPKILRKQAGLARSLCEEARFAAKINHPNVVKVFDVTHSPDLTFVVMEYIDGEPLSNVIYQRGVLETKTILALGLDITAGLNAGFEQGLIHRDIKPANIIMARSGSAKIVDLGLAVSSPAHGAVPREATSSLVGTHGYMSPEVMAKQPIDFRSDIYSLGVTLYHAAVGRLPFPNVDRDQSIRLHQAEPVPDPRRLRPELSVPFAELLLWMLAKDPTKRPQSYLELAEAVRAVQQSPSSLDHAGERP